jgi:hypothetical protein
VEFHANQLKSVQNRRPKLSGSVGLQPSGVTTMALQRPKQQTCTDSGPEQTEQREYPSIRATSIDAPESQDAIEHTSAHQGEANGREDKASDSSRERTLVSKTAA